MRKVIAVAALALIAACGGTSDSETRIEGPDQDEALTPPATATDSIPSLSNPPETAGPPMMMDTAPRPVYGAPVQRPGPDTLRP